MQDVIFFNCRALVAAVPFFTNADAAFVSEVVTKLAYEVFQPGQYEDVKSFYADNISSLKSLSEAICLIERSTN